MLVMNPFLLSQGWMHAKLGCVLLLAATTFYADHARKRLAAGTWRHGSKIFRYLNELPTLLMIAIVIFVIVRPF
jgi:putative membrane protein